MPRTPMDTADVDERRENRQRKRRSLIYDSSYDTTKRKPDKVLASADEHTQRSAIHEPSLRPTTKRLSGTEFQPPLRIGTPQIPSSSRRNHDGDRNGSQNRASATSNRQTPPSNVPRGSHSRPRTRTLEEKGREKSPSSLVAKTRQRIGSLHSSPISDVVEQSTSIGFPSIVPSPPLESQLQGERRRLTKTPQSRNLSPIRSARGGSTAQRNLNGPASAESKRILHLMRTTCGRMAGILSFRTDEAPLWSSGYCAINVASGSLIYQKQGDVSHAKTLIHDLRGCQVRTLYDALSQSTFLEVAPRAANTGVHLRPHVLETFDSWLAALLCWQPIKPKSIASPPTTSPPPIQAPPPRRPSATERRLGDRRRNSEALHGQGAAIIKVGTLLMWDSDARLSKSFLGNQKRASTYKAQRSMSKAWKKVSCTLQENGNLKLYTEKDISHITTIALSTLSRCAIQRLDPSILDDEFSLAIYPKNSPNATTPASSRPIYLAMDTRLHYEVWFVLLRAFATPELYGAQDIATDPALRPPDAIRTVTSPMNPDLFRLERRLLIRIVEARMSTKDDGGAKVRPGSRPTSKEETSTGNYFVEVMIDDEVRGKTVVKQDTSKPFWREDFEIPDLPATLAGVSFDVRSRNPGQKDWTLVASDSELIEHESINDLSLLGNIQISPLDLLHGKVFVRFDSLDKLQDTERWWPILSTRGQVVGDVLMKVRLEELMVLMGQEYKPLSDMLHAFSTNLTSHISQAIHGELRRLSETLLNIFQVSAQVSDWIMYLLEDEIDNLHKEPQMQKLRYGRRIASNDSKDSGIERELIVRDMNKSASAEANLLFRGNSLVTKALDLHMQRLGKEYLEETLSERVRDVDESDPHCEVDPNKVSCPDDLERNWRNLIALTENFWKVIASSANRCPPELRLIFRHIRACADDRYGDFSRNVKYSSVSGFLFLRFLVPAVLNPKLFGLLKDHPRPRAQRTLTLVAKSLQTLANLSTFGTKEHWMEPMNTFLNSHKQALKDFIDAICTVQPERATTAIPPSYATPITILNRLPPTNREGFPSLPYLIDQAKECASLVELWLDSRHEIPAQFKRTEELNKFDALCEKLHQKSKHCVDRMNEEQGVQDPNWEGLVEQMERKAHIRDSQAQFSPPVQESLASSTSSLSDSYFSQYRAYGPLDDVRRQRGANNVHRVYHHEIITDLDPDPFNSGADASSQVGSYWPSGANGQPYDPSLEPSESGRTANTFQTDHDPTPSRFILESHQSSTFSLATSSVQADAGTPSTLSPVSLHYNNNHHHQHSDGPPPPSGTRSIYSLTPHPRPASANQHRYHLGGSSGNSSGGRRLKTGRTMSGDVEHRSLREHKSKSIYRLPSHSSPGPGTASGIGPGHVDGRGITPPRSPPSRDGLGRKFGDWSNFLGRGRREK